MDLKIIYEEPYVSALEVGVFAEGPEFEDDANLPLSGSATYIGDFNGVFAYTDINQRNQLGKYVGDLELNVDFGTNSIAGHIGLNDRRAPRKIREVHNRLEGCEQRKVAVLL